MDSDVDVVVLTTLPEHVGWLPFVEEVALRGPTAKDLRQLLSKAGSC